MKSKNKKRSVFIDDTIDSGGSSNTTGGESNTSNMPTTVDIGQPLSPSIRGYDVSVDIQDAMSYASPGIQSTSLLVSLVMAHALVLASILLTTVSDKLDIPIYFVATKSFHCFIGVFGMYFAILSYQKPLLVSTNKIDFLDSKLIYLLLITFGLLIVDFVFFGKDFVPTMMDCYKDPEPIPLPDACTDHDKRLVYTVLFTLVCLHIVLQLLIIVVSVVARIMTNGDILYTQKVINKNR